jgi:hypothetical protein
MDTVTDTSTVVGVSIADLLSAGGAREVARGAARNVVEGFGQVNRLNNPFI